MGKMPWWTRLVDALRRISTEDTCITCGESIQPEDEGYCSDACWDTHQAERPM